VVLHRSRRLIPDQLASEILPLYKTVILVLAEPVLACLHYREGLTFRASNAGQGASAFTSLDFETPHLASGQVLLPAGDPASRIS
jgi:hypothetical protein